MSHDLGTLAEYPDGAPTARRVGDRAIVVVRIGDEVFALEDRCSHEDFPLSCGEVDVTTGEIECERHGAMFRLADGSAVSLPATRAVTTFAVAVRDGHVWLDEP